jgi:hypothetical protein
MGAGMRYATLATGTVGFQRAGSIAPGLVESSALWEPEWQYQSRSPKTWRDTNNFFSRWPSSCFMNAGSLDYCLMSQEAGADRGQYEPFSCDGPGTQSRNAIRGQCLDNVSAPVAGALVQGFVTATDAYCGEVQSLEDGTYILCVEQGKATPIYLVAYKPGSPDIAGTTVNTLLATNVDGS